MFQSAQHVSGNFFPHLQERKTVFYSLWYDAPKLLPAGGLELGGPDYVFGVKVVARRSLALLRMDKKIARNLLS
jgi:hypothetical protein